MAASIFPLAADHLGNLRLPGGIVPSAWNEFHDLVFMDEVARCGYLGVVFGIACGNVIGAPPIIRFGTAAQKRKYVPDILNGKIRFCLAVTEPDAGSDVAGLKTTAVRRGDKYIVNGAKKWITNGLWADYCTAAVRTGGKGHNGISALIIPLNSPGVTRRKLYNSGVSASGKRKPTAKRSQVRDETLTYGGNKALRISSSTMLKFRLRICSERRTKASPSSCRVGTGPHATLLVPDGQSRC